jgi:hypothetical protein
MSGTADGNVIREAGCPEWLRGQAAFSRLSLQSLAVPDRGSPAAPVYDADAA